MKIMASYQLVGILTPQKRKRTFRKSDLIESTFYENMTAVFMITATDVMEGNYGPFSNLIITLSVDELINRLPFYKSIFIPSFNMLNQINRLANGRCSGTRGNCC